MTALQLDHFFVTVPPPPSSSSEQSAAPSCNAIEKEAISIGFIESHRRIHPNQGTANVCYHFGDDSSCQTRRGGYVEFLCARDTSKLQSDPVKPTGFEYRCLPGSPADCPFGLCFRVDGRSAIPIKTWTYDVPFPAGSGLGVEMAINSIRSDMPLIFFVVDSNRKDHNETTGGAGFSVRRLSHPHPLDDTTRAVLSAAGVETEEGPWRMEVAVKGLEDRKIMRSAPLDLCPS